MGSTTSMHRADAAKASQGSHEAVEAVQGLQVFEISGYRQRIGACESPVFTVGGHDWQILHYLRGRAEINSEEYMALYLCLRDKSDDTRVMASVQLSFVDVTGSSPPHTFTTKFDSDGAHRVCGTYKFMKRSELEASPYLRDNRLTIACHITIIKESRAIADEVRTFTEVPPSNITEHLEKLLRGKEGADVVFVVGREDFPAHKAVLAMRSPVFKAELYGVMKENGTSRITIDDMQPAVFDALLHFIYTDSLSPAMDRLGGDDYKEMIRHLLVAADRYAMERLKVICESILCETLDVKTVMTTLALADQHHCGRLKNACVKYIASLGAKEIDGVMASKVLWCG